MNISLLKLYSQLYSYIIPSNSDMAAANFDLLSFIEFIYDVQFSKDQNTTFNFFIDLTSNLELFNSLIDEEKHQLAFYLTLHRLQNHYSDLDLLYQIFHNFNYTSQNKIIQHIAYKTRLLMIPIYHQLDKADEEILQLIDDIHSTPENIKYIA